MQIYKYIIGIKLIVFYFLLLSANTNPVKHIIIDSVKIIQQYSY